MPISSQRRTILHPQRIIILKPKTKVADSSFQSIENSSSSQEKDQSSLNSKRSSPWKKSDFTDNLREVSKKPICNRLLLIAALVFLTLLIMALVAIAIVLPLVLRSQQTTTTITTTTTTTTTTTPSCISPYARTPSGICTNTLIDFNNCGGIGMVCANTFTSCSAGVCDATVPTVQLSNPTSIWTGANNGSSDDDLFNVTLPFSINVYGTITNQLQITTNGVICLSTCSNVWIETSLPSNSFGATLFPYWDDLYIYAKTWQGIYYAVQGNAPTRTFTIEYYTSHYGSPNQFYQFQVIFSETTPSSVQFTYFNAADTGASCTVGIQGTGAGQVVQHSFHQVNSVLTNMLLTFDAIHGTYTNVIVG